MAPGSPSPRSAICGLMPIDGAPQRMTSDRALDTEPAWSPDGNSIAYASDRGGSMNIWIRDVQTGASRQLTRLPVAATLPAWSPDASRIAFVDAGGQLQVVDVKSGAIRKIHDHLNEPGRPSWSPDGSAVVVSSLKVYSTRFREGDNKVLRVPLDGSGDRWLDPAAEQVDRHARGLRPGLVAGRHTDGRHHRRPADRVARRPRRRADSVRRAGWPPISRDRRRGAATRGGFCFRPTAG